MVTLKCALMRLVCTPSCFVVAWTIGVIAAGPPVHAQCTAVQVPAGNLPGNTTWTAGNVYVLASYLRVPAGLRLVIEPGATVKLPANGYLEIYGVLDARGQPDDKIVFTSLQDDSSCGDTNGDGGATAPLPGDWAWVVFMDGSVDQSCILEHVDFRYGGRSGGTYRGAVDLRSASPTIRSCTFEQNAGYGITVDLSSFPAVEGNAMVDNGTNGIGVFPGAGVPAHGAAAAHARGVRERCLPEARGREPGRRVQPCGI